MIETQHLDHMFQRPFRQAAEIGAKLGFQLQGARSRPFDRMADPQPLPCRFEQRVAAQTAVAQQAIPRPSLRHPFHRLQAQQLEIPDLFMRCTGLIGNRLQLHPVVKGKDFQIGPVAGAVGRPMKLLQFRILAQRRVDHTTMQEKLQFLPTGIGRGAAVAADGKGPAGIGEFQACGPVLAGQPAFQQARHEAVPRPQHVEHLDRKALPRHTLFQRIGDGTGKGNSPHRPAFADQGRG